MPFKTRIESDELKILKSLNARMELSSEDKQHLFTLSKGYMGEVMFDNLTAELGLDRKFYILNDLQLECNSTSFQIDSLFVAQQSVIPFEVKNFESNYLFEHDNFYYLLTKKKITNPLHQLNRGETLLQQLLLNNGFDFPTESYLSFINPEFFLYKAPFDKKIIFPSQHRRFFKDLAARPSKLSEQHRDVADFLVQAHKPYSPYSKLPPYTYGSVRKGLLSLCCHSFYVFLQDRKLICQKCGTEEPFQEAVMRSVEELKLLFPGIKIDAPTVIDWCGLDDHKRKVRRILLNNYQKKRLWKIYVLYK